MLEKGADSPGEDRITVVGGRGGYVELLPISTLVMIVLISVESDNIAVVNVVVGLEGGGTGGDEAEAVDTPVGGTGGMPGGDKDEIIGVICGVLVTKVLKRLGGAMLFSHSVVPLTTEK